MELKYIVLTIIKILISVPAIVLVAPLGVDAAALMGGHIDNKSNSTALLNLTSSYFDLDLDNDQELSAKNSDNQNLETDKKSSAAIRDAPQESEEIPDPSPLVVPGYNLPENIFNQGRPFYLEKDPLTGAVDFENRSPDLKLYDDYDFVEDEPSSDMYDKANIDRRDGSLGGHKTSDVNQLTPNLYDFLNLPLRYNSDKYVYPLVSSSYANTKIQGNVNKHHHHNHKEYPVTTYKAPTYFSTKSGYFNKDYKTNAKTTTTTTTTTTPRTTTQVYLTTKEVNLMNSAMNHPSFNEEFFKSTEKPIVDEIFLTTTTTTTTTERTLSLFEQLLADFDEPIPSTQKPNKEKQSNDYGDTNGHENVLDGTNMAHQSAYDYDYEDGVTDSIAVENGPAEVHVVAREPDRRDEQQPNQDGGNKESQYEAQQPNRNEPPTKPQSNAFGTEGTAVEPKDGAHEKLEIASADNKKENFGEEEPNGTEYRIDLTTEFPAVPKVTSLPLGENHVTYNSPIIVATQNLREKLNGERVAPPKPFGHLRPVPSTSNIHIPPDQDTVSFVVGNHQNVDGQYIGSALKESPYDSNPFKPLYGVDNKNGLAYTAQIAPVVYQSAPGTYQAASGSHQAASDASETYQIASETYQVAKPRPIQVSNSPPQNFNIGPGSIKIQPIKNSEASLAIGVPVDMVKVKPGQVVDESLDIEEEKIEFPKGGGAKIVLAPNPSNDYAQHLLPPAQPGREVLKLNSQPMFHQLPSDLTPPPSENGPPLPPHVNRERPPWDPRPGHFHSGRPEYARPPRPAQNDAYKRIDTLPNILPQFRPNMKPHRPFEHVSKGYLRQPLLDRPSNRPVGFFEKLHPPPPPKLLQNLRKVLPVAEQQQELNYQRKVPPVEQQELNFRRKVSAEDRIHEDYGQNLRKVPPTEQSAENYKKSDQFSLYQTPPKVVLATRRNGDEDVEVETLQMLQAKQDKKDKVKIEVSSSFQTNLNGKDSIEKPIYVVYPVKTPPLKLDAIDTNKKEAVVIGTRAELPLPPSKIQQERNEADQDFSFKPQDFDFHTNERHDSPILRPHHRPGHPVRSDFPYPLERPDLVGLSSVPALLSVPGNDLESQKFAPGSSNQWNSLDESKINAQSDQISVKLKTYSEKPIAVAYTPTEPHDGDRYSMPNYAGPVIPEIRPGSSQPERDPADNKRFRDKVGHESAEPSLETTHVPQLDFQAPFQASLNVDNVSHGWSVIKEKAKGGDGDETTTPSVSTTSEFDIENFKPQLIGGFKPIYDFPEERDKSESEVKEREE